MNFVLNIFAYKTNRFWLFVFFVVAIFFILQINLPPSKAQPVATTLRVATNGTDSSSCGTVTQPCRTIQKAVNNSNSGDTILVAAGTYTYSGSSTCLDGVSTAVVCVLSTHLTILGGYTTGNWNEADPVTNVTIIDGQNARRGVQLHGPTASEASLHIEGFTIQNGRKQGAAGGGDSLTFAFGAGMLADRGSVEARNLIFKNNQAIGGNTSSAYGGAASGGGMALRSNSNGVVLENIAFENNTATGGTGPERGGFGIGGGLYTFSAVVTGSDLTFTNNQAIAGTSTGSGISGGNYADAQGGGAAFHVGSDVTLDGVTATGNQALAGDAPNGDAGGAFGGGLYAEQTTVSLTNVDLRQNLSEGGDGNDPTANSSLGDGGGFASARSDVTFIQATIINNTARGGDGVVYRGAGGGGGIYFSGFAEDNTLSLTNVILADNLSEMGSTGSVTGGGGGGIFLNGGQADLTHVTLAQNELGAAPMQGIGIVMINGGTADIDHSIFADHTQYSSALTIHAQSGNSVNLDTNLFSGNGTDTGGGGTFIGTGSNLSGDPDFVSAGSPNFNYHINSASAAIDQASGSTTAVDIDNQSRSLFGAADVGADEYAPLIFSISQGNESLYLRWEADSELLPGLDHYNIVYTKEGGAGSPSEGTSPINAGTATTFTLTGVTNGKDYTITIEARNGSNGLIASSNTIVTFPTDDLVYLPLVIK